MSFLVALGNQYGMALADGSFWIITAGDEAAAQVISRMAEVMELNVISPAISSEYGVFRRLHVSVDNQCTGTSRLANHASTPTGDSGIVHCVLPEFQHAKSLYLQSMQVSAVIARETQIRGGILLHGALAEREGMGVILAAPGGTGKSTASHRLPDPWRSLCDDTTLVVPDPKGGFRAHPWPTWSRFLHEGSDHGSWDTQYSVRLFGVFILTQAADDRTEPVMPGQSVSLLVECAKQSSTVTMRGIGKEEIRSLNLQRFNNICSMTRAVPVHLLHISLVGTFWRKIESALDI